MPAYELLLTPDIQITFRPVKLEKYEDEVEFLLANGSFSVPLNGLTPVLGIQVLPEDLNFGYVAVMESGQRSFSVQNTGDLPASFKWKFEEPFRITPATGQIPQGSICDFTVRFAPQEASVFSAKVGHPQHDYWFDPALVPKIFFVSCVCVQCSWCSGK